MNNEKILFSQDVTEKIWLQYFNDALFGRGLITEKERNRIANAVGQQKTGRVSHRKAESPAAVNPEKSKEETL